MLSAGMMNRMAVCGNDESNGCLARLLVNVVARAELCFCIEGSQFRIGAMNCIHSSRQMSWAIAQVSPDFDTWRSAQEV